MRNGYQTGYDAEIHNAYEKLMALEKAKILEEYNLPEKPSSDGYFHTYVPDVTKKSGRKQIKAKTIDELIQKIYDVKHGVRGNCFKTFREVFEIVEEKRVENIKDETDRKSAEKTSRKNKSDYKRFFADTAFESKTIGQITKKDVEDICLFNLNRYDIRPKTYQGMQAILRSVFRLAFQEYWIDDNIFERVDFKQFNKMCVHATPIKEREYSSNERELILDSIHEKMLKNPEYIPAYAVEFQIMLGLRHGEVPPLEWNDIIEVNGIYYLEITKCMLSDGTVVDHTKTHKNRSIPLSQDVLEFLRTLKKVQKKYRYSDKYLFPARSKSGMMSYNMAADFFLRTREKLGIDGSYDCKRGLHAYRRTVESELRNKGADPTMIANIMGHSVIVAEKNYYTGGYNEDRVRAIFDT